MHEKAIYYFSKYNPFKDYSKISDYKTAYLLVIKKVFITSLKKNSYKKKNGFWQEVEKQ